MELKEAANQGVEYIKQFCERLRLSENVDLMKIMTFQDIANFHISLNRITQCITGVQDNIKVQEENDKLHHTLNVNTAKITELQNIIHNLDEKLRLADEDIKIVDINTEPAPAPTPARKQISQL
jgi:hypothetical protein